MQTQQQCSMAITNDMWMVRRQFPAADQVRDFPQAVCGKDERLDDGPQVRLLSKMLAQNPAAGQAMLSDMAGEMRKLYGVPIMQVMRMGTTVESGNRCSKASDALAAS